MRKLVSIATIALASAGMVAAQDSNTLNVEALMERDRADTPPDTRVDNAATANCPIS